MAERPAEHQVPVGDEDASALSARLGGRPSPEPSHAERCRTLVASASGGALSTLAIRPEGYPYGSVTSYGLDDQGNPLFFVSLMAEHTQNAMRDPRASLLVIEPVPDGAGRLASGRVTLLGLLSTVAWYDLPTARDRYLDANPTAAYYIDFGDFVFYRLDVEIIRYVGGYGRMSWVDAAAYAQAEPDPLAAAAAGIIEHMNAHHAEAQILFCRHLADRPDTTEAVMSSVHRYGFEMVGRARGSRRRASRLSARMHRRRTGPRRNGRHGGGRSSRRNPVRVATRSSSSERRPAARRWRRRRILRARMPPRRRSRTWSTARVDREESSP